MVASTSQIGIAGHDRYLIYKMLGRKVSFRASSRKSQGTVEHVCRNIFDKKVEVTVNGRTHVFDEPMSILQEGETVIFVYGDLCLHNTGDDALFANLHENAYRGDSMNEVLRKTSYQAPQMLRFDLGPRAKRHRSWTRRKSN